MGLFSTIVQPGFPTKVAVFDATGQQANIPATILYTVPASQSGMYRLSGYAVVTQPATTSSTLSRILFGYTDEDSGVVFPVNSQILVNGSSNNTLGLTSLAGSVVARSIFIAKAGTVINFSVDQYASVGATPMQYALHLKLEYLGP